MLRSDQLKYISLCYVFSPSNFGEDRVLDVPHCGAPTGISGTKCFLDDTASLDLCISGVKKHCAVAELASSGALQVIISLESFTIHILISRNCIIIDRAVQDERPDAVPNVQGHREQSKWAIGNKPKFLLFCVVPLSYISFVSALQVSSSWFFTWCCAVVARGFCVLRACICVVHCWYAVCRFHHILSRSASALHFPHRLAIVMARVETITFMQGAP